MCAHACAGVCAVNRHLRKLERAPSDTYNDCSKARHRAAIFVLTTSLPSLLASCFPALAGLRRACRAQLRRGFVLWQAKCSYKTACQPVHLLSTLKSVPPSRFWFIFKTTRSPFYALASFSSYWIHETPMILHSGPHLSNQITYWGIVSLKHTGFGVFVCEQSIQSQEID